MSTCEPGAAQCGVCVICQTVWLLHDFAALRWLEVRVGVMNLLEQQLSDFASWRQAAKISELAQEPFTTKTFHTFSISSREVPVTLQMKATASAGGRISPRKPNWRSAASLVCLRKLLSLVTKTAHSGCVV